MGQDENKPLPNLSFVGSPNMCIHFLFCFFASNMSPGEASGKMVPLDFRGPERAPSKKGYNSSLQVALQTNSMNIWFTTLCSLFTRMHLVDTPKALA